MIPHPEILIQTAQLLLQEADPDTLCRAVFNELRGPLGVDVYFHYLVSPDESHLELASSEGAARLRSGFATRLDFGSAVCGTVAQECAWRYVPQVQQRNDPMTALIREVGVRCYVCHPLAIRGRLLGTLSFGSTSRAEYGEQELEVFRLIAQQVTLASDRRLQSERLRELERLATAGRMSATLAHEINNPLESLGHLLFLLDDEVRSHSARELIQQAEEQVSQLAATVQHTLELFRGGQHSATTFDLAHLVHELVAGLHLPGNARLESSVEDGLCVHMIPGELRQVLFNLLTNAAHFTPPGKPVVLTVARAGTMAEVKIRDEGPGINGDTAAKLFQPFFTTRGKQGTGIGLWLSKEMVERGGGRLSFHSDPATRPGTEFVVTLPLVS